MNGTVSSYICLQTLFHEIQGKEILNMSDLEEELRSVTAPFQAFQAYCSLTLWSKSKLMVLMDKVLNQYEQR